MGKSIFDLDEKSGYESPFGDWIAESNAADTRRGSERFASSAAATSADIELLNEDRVFAIKTDVLLEFMLSGATNFFNDTWYNVKITSSDSNLKISTKSWGGENDYKLLTKVSLQKPGKVKLFLWIDGAKKRTFEIEFKKSKDVFKQTEVDRFTDEYNYLSGFVDVHSPAEYNTNYCMQGADRALGKLLNNSSDFYAVARGTHNVTNSINFSGLNTYSRAKQLNSKGFIHSSYTIESKYWNVDHNKRAKINAKYPPYEDAQDYAIKVMYDLAWVNTIQGVNFYIWLKKNCDETEPGFHVYYLSIVDGFHTQVLLIDNTDRSNPRYEIWEDHGLSSSKGKLSDIVDGINRQTSAMFTSSCLIRLKSGTQDKWDSQKLKVWKMKKK